MNTYHIHQMSKPNTSKYSTVSNTSHPNQWKWHSSQKLVYMKDSLHYLVWRCRWVLHGKPCDGRSQTVIATAPGYCWTADGAQAWARWWVSRDICQFPEELHDSGLSKFSFPWMVPGWEVRKSKVVWDIDIWLPEIVFVEWWHEQRVLNKAKSTLQNQWSMFCNEYCHQGRIKGFLCQNWFPRIENHTNWTMTASTISPILF